MNYFLPKNNRLYSAFVHIRPLYRYLLTVLIISSIGYGWFTMIYTKIDALIHQSCIEIEQLQNQQNSGKQSPKICQELEQSIKSMDRLLSQHYDNNQIPADILQTRMTMVLDLAHQNNLLLGTVHIEQEYEKEWLMGQIITVDFNGELTHIFNFFDSLLAQKTLISCENLSLKKISPPQFNLKCTLNICVLK